MAPLLLEALFLLGMGWVQEEQAAEKHLACPLFECRVNELLV